MLPNEKREREHVDPIKKKTLKTRIILYHIILLPLFTDLGFA